MDWHAFGIRLALVSAVDRKALAYLRATKGSE
jgi:hypothetical protein